MTEHHSTPGPASARRVTDKPTRSQQVAERIRGQIRSGHWQVGSQLPSVRQLARQYDVSVNTAQDAMKLLEAEQVIETRPRRRGRVSSIPSDDQAPLQPRARRRSASHILMIGTLAPEKRRNPEHNEESWSSRIVEAAERRLFQRSTCYLTRICSMQTDPHLHAQETAEQIRDLAPQASGAILFNVNHDSRAAVLETLDTQSLPWVSINRPNDHIHYNYVSCRNLCAGRIAGRCFAEQGLRHIVILSPPLHAAVGMLEKVLGVYQAFIQQGLPTQQIVCLTKGSYTEPEGYRMMRSYLEQADPMPQAVFATGDWLAMGAARACREFGLRIPQDISILGSTGLSICPDLSVITQPMEQMGQTAADMLLEMMQTGQQRISCQEIPGQFIDRGSVVLTESLRRFIQHEHTRIVEQAQAETLMTY